MNINKLLDPVSPSNPCGDDLSYSAEFDAISEWRRADDPTLDQGEWVTPLKSADWQRVHRSCVELLQNRTKDLRLAMWLTEADLHLAGHAGLARGLALCVAMCEQHWEGLHPRPDDGDMEARVGNMAWLLSRLPTWVMVAPLCPARHATLSLQDVAVIKSGVGSSAQDGPGGSWERTRVDLVAWGPAAWQAIQDELSQCGTQLQRWQTVTDSLLGDAGPSFYAAREALDRASHELRRLMSELGMDVYSVASEPSAEPGMNAPSAIAVVVAPRPAAATNAQGFGVHSREQALSHLQAVAAYFRAHEPHSPVAYLVDKAAQWGEMPLHDWLRCVVKDGGTLAQLEDLLGVSPNSP